MTHAPTHYAKAVGELLDEPGEATPEPVVIVLEPLDLKGDS